MQGAPAFAVQLASVFAEMLRHSGGVMTDGVQSLDGKVPWRHLVRLEHRLKPEDRVKARIAEDMRVKGRTLDDAFATLGDAIRFAFQYPEDRYTEGVLGDLPPRPASR